MNLYALNARTVALVVAAPSLQHARDLASRWTYNTTLAEPVAVTPAAWYRHDAGTARLGRTDGDPGVRAAWTSPAPLERVHPPWWAPA